MPIIVNKAEISDDEVHAEMQYHPAGTIEEARHKAAQTLVIRQLLLQEAADKKILDSEGEEGQAIDMLLQQEVSVPEADDESCERYYQQNQVRFMDKKTDKILPLESVVQHIRDYMHARSLQTGISQYIKILAGNARIAGFEFDYEGSDSPLVQ